jgi:hypothetical protein
VVRQGKKGDKLPQTSVYRRRKKKYNWHLILIRLRIINMLWSIYYISVIFKKEIDVCGNLSPFFPWWTTGASSKGKGHKKHLMLIWLVYLYVIKLIDVDITNNYNTMLWSIYYISVIFKKEIFNNYIFKGKKTSGKSIICEKQFPKSQFL